MANIFSIDENRSLYVVRTNRTNPRHHGLRENTSRYVATFFPSPGDEIAYLLGGTLSKWGMIPKENNPSNWRLLAVTYKVTTRSFSPSNPFERVRISLTSHPGHGSAIGVDDEDKTGYSVLKDLISETFDPRGGDDGWGWRYAPVVVEEGEKTDGLFRFFRFTLDDGWQEQEVNREEYYRTSNLVVRIAKEQEIDLDFDFDGVEID